MAHDDDHEEWVHRARCPECRSVIWTAPPVQRCVCICGGSWLETDGTRGGLAEDTTDGQMTAFIRTDHAREVVLLQRPV